MIKKLPTAGLIIIRHNEVLLAYSNNKQAWYLPGGKIDVGESAIEALKREIKEELNLTLCPDRLQYYCHVSALAYGEYPAVMMEQECFIYDLQEEVQASNEIDDLRYFDLPSYQLQKVQVEGVLTVFYNLKNDGKIII